MDYLQAITTDNFNWDDIDVGNHALDHSQKFFAKKHFKHERLDESEEGMDLLNEIDAITLDDTYKPSHDKENSNLMSTPKSSKKSPLKEIQAIITPNKGNKPEEIKPKNRLCISPGNVAENVEEVKGEKTASSTSSTAATDAVNFSDSLIARNRARINPGGRKKTSPPKSPLANAEAPKSNAVILSESLITRNKARINPGVKKETIADTQAANGDQAGAVAKTVPKPAPPKTPHAYQCTEMYKRRKEELVRKLSEEERKKREFHSRPVPNFSACHKSVQSKKVLHAVTVPVTPVVLKKSRETEKKRKQKLEELRKIHPQRFEPRPPTAVHEEPFVPKKIQTASVPCPFNLRSERRLQERKQYDAAVQFANEEKQKQEEEERKKREDKRVKELRKLTIFKARPNPFK